MLWQRHTLPQYSIDTSNIAMKPDNPSNCFTGAQWHHRELRVSSCGHFVGTWEGGTFRSACFTQHDPGDCIIVWNQSAKTRSNTSASSVPGRRTMGDFLSSLWTTSGSEGAAALLNNWELEGNWGHRSIISRGLFSLWSETLAPRKVVAQWWWIWRERQERREEKGGNEI